MNRFILAAASAACALCATVSCTEGFSTKTIGSSDKYALAEGGTDSLEIDIQVEYPVSGLTQPAMDNVTKTLTTSLFGDQYAAMQPEEAIDAYISGSVDEYRKDNLPLLEMSKDMPHASLSWSDYITGAVAGSHGDILSYTMTKYTYTGGAHGMTSETALNFDMKTGSLLTEGLPCCPGIWHHRWRIRLTPRCFSHAKSGRTATSWSLLKESPIYTTSMRSGLMSWGPSG